MGKFLAVKYFGEDNKIGAPALAIKEYLPLEDPQALPDNYTRVDLPEGRDYNEYVLELNLPYQEDIDAAVEAHQILLNSAKTRKQIFELIWDTITRDLIEGVPGAVERKDMVVNGINKYPIFAYALDYKNYAVARDTLSTILSDGVIDQDTHDWIDSLIPDNSLSE